MGETVHYRVRVYPWRSDACRRLRLIPCRYIRKLGGYDMYRSGKTAASSRAHLYRYDPISIDLLAGGRLFITFIVYPTVFRDLFVFNTRGERGVEYPGPVQYDTRTPQFFDYSTAKCINTISPHILYQFACCRKKRQKHNWSGRKITDVSFYPTTLHTLKQTNDIFFIKYDNSAYN